MKLPQFLAGNNATPLPRWTDAELLRQLLAHASKPDPLFDEGPLDRLQALAGVELPRRRSGAWWSADRLLVLELVELARSRVSSPSRVAA